MYSAGGCHYCAIHSDPQFEQVLSLICAIGVEQTRPRCSEFLLQCNDNSASVLQVASNVEQAKKYALWGNSHEIIKVTAAALSVVNRAHVAIANLRNLRLKRVLPGHYRGLFVVQSCDHGLARRT